MAHEQVVGILNEMSPDDRTATTAGEACRGRARISLAAAAARARSPAMTLQRVVLLSSFVLLGCNKPGPAPAEPPAAAHVTKPDGK